MALLAHFTGGMMETQRRAHLRSHSSHSRTETRDQDPFLPEAAPPHRAHGDSAFQILEDPIPALTVLGSLWA